MASISSASDFTTRSPAPSLPPEILAPILQMLRADDVDTLEQQQMRFNFQLVARGWHYSSKLVPLCVVVDGADRCEKLATELDRRQQGGQVEHQVRGITLKAVLHGEKEQRSVALLLERCESLRLLDLTLLEPEEVEGGWDEEVEGGWDEEDNDDVLPPLEEALKFGAVFLRSWSLLKELTALKIRSGPGSIHTRNVLQSLWETLTHVKVLHIYSEFEEDEQFPTVETTREWAPLSLTTLDLGDCAPGEAATLLNASKSSLKTLIGPSITFSLFSQRELLSTLRQIAPTLTRFSTSIVFSTFNNRAANIFRPMINLEHLDIQSTMLDGTELDLVDLLLPFTQLRRLTIWHEDLELSEIEDYLQIAPPSFKSIVYNCNDWSVEKGKVLEEVWREKGVEVRFCPGYAQSTPPWLRFPRL